MRYTKKITLSKFADTQYSVCRQTYIEIQKLLSNCTLLVELINLRKNQ